MKIRITFFEEALGSTPAKEDMLREYIASKAPDAVKTEEEVAARGVTLQEYEPAYQDAEEVPEQKRAVLLRALQMEDAALALMLGMAAESVNLADKVALYERALAMIREEYGLQMGRLVTFARFKAMIAKEIEKIAKAGR